MTQLGIGKVTGARLPLQQHAKDRYEAVTDNTESGVCACGNIFQVLILKAIGMGGCQALSDSDLSKSFCSFSIFASTISVNKAKCVSKQ